MDHTTPSINPYAAPEGRVEDVHPGGPSRQLAERPTRLGAAIIDGLCYLVAIIPAMVLLWPFEPGDFTPVAYMYASAAPILVVNLYLLWRSGQTIGKKLLGIRITRKDGSDASLTRIFLLRMVAPSVLGAIPMLGIFFGLANVLFIFGSARRCIHDYMADTIVVQTA